jgi:prepilin-type processing-associated H-X9-DG protein
MPAEECCQRCAIRTGALWKFLNQEKVYRCPTGDTGALVTYTIIDSMNGKYMYSDAPIGLCNKTLGQIKNASQRTVFLDEGSLSPDSFAVYYKLNQWFDPPMVRHSKGTNISFADGHAARMMWKADETLKAGKNVSYNYEPTTCAGKIDLYKMQVYCWGKIGPGYPLDPDCKYAIDE